MKIENYVRNIKQLIKKHKTIFIVGHRDLDLDAIGSSLGMYYITKKYHKDAYIIVDDETHELGVEKIISEQDSDIFKHSKEIPNLKSNSNLLIIVDTNKINLLPNPEIIEHFNDLIIIDHHQPSMKSIKKGYQIIDPETSSTCQLITELLYDYSVKIPNNIATAILSGIVLDTNNFVLKTDADTYFAAHFLTKQGADPKKVQYYLKQDINDYIIRQQAITNVEVIKGRYAITVGHHNVIYRREELAKIADTLLQFNGIVASFVLGLTSKTMIGLSARSDGTLNVGNIAEGLNGGGDNHNAASQIESTNLIEIKEKLLKEISKEELK
ncbi:MAG: DHH family phosphoesterase [bacterium]|nr:DHH family phosphoesterase [bacterium]